MEVHTARLYVNFFTKLYAFCDSKSYCLSFVSLCCIVCLFWWIICFLFVCVTRTSVTEEACYRYVCVLSMICFVFYSEKGKGKAWYDPGCYQNWSFFSYSTVRFLISVQNDSSRFMWWVLILMYEWMNEWKFIYSA